MIQTNELDYALERRLQKINPALHRHFTDAVFGLQNVLSNYKLLFPAYTDHTELHSLNVIDFCNRLIGNQIEKLNADEIYSLLLGCYFHDTGMGISKKDYERFSKEIDFGDYFETHTKDDPSRIIRDFHNEFSGCFIRKYADFFEIPSKDHLWTIIEISRGHRKTPLLDEKQYPVSLELENGSTICVPYLAALIRLADEIDVSKQRNSILMYDSSAFTEENDIMQFKRHEAIREMQMTPDEFILHVKTDSDKVMDSIRTVATKMQFVLDECRKAVNGRTPFTISQKQVVIQKIVEE